MKNKTKHNIYFHVQQFVDDCCSNTHVSYFKNIPGCHSVDNDAIFINVNKILSGGHGALDKLPDFNAQFNLIVSHEVLHSVLQNFISEEASTWLDYITVEFWYKNIDINTNMNIEIY